MSHGPLLLSQTFLPKASVRGLLAPWFTGVSDLAGRVLALTIKVKVNAVEFQAWIKNRAKSFGTHGVGIDG